MRAETSGDDQKSGSPAKVPSGRSPVGPSRVHVIVRNVGAAALAALLAVPPAGAQTADGAPQSAIPWLSDSLARPRTADPVDEPAATPLTETEVTVLPLGTTRRDAVGLRPASATGLPRDLFAGSDPARLADLIARQPADALPAMQTLVQTLLTAEFDPPRAATDPDMLFFARIDALLRLGALEQAQALLEQAGATDSRAFRRWWDASLLTGFDTRACDAMTANPGIAPTLPARIFCLSRGGDWPAAALSLETGRAIGAITEAEDRLLAHFLDPELFEGEPPPIPPRPMTPLAFRLLDGIGETPATRDLPLAFAVADLRSTVGWKAQIEAAERLTRVGAIPFGRLLSLYTERRPSASGGVWERAAAIQRLDTALLSGEAQRVADALPAAVARMREVGLVVPFANAYGPRLARLDLPAAAAAMAIRMGLLSWDYGTVARLADPASPLDRFAVAIARGDVAAPPAGLVPGAVADGLTGAPPARLADLARGDRRGEALLEAALLLADGTESDPGGIADALALLIAAGLEDTARRTALQLLLS
ncbi:MAG: hypothetical protein AAF390_12710 [Pseudomonadota bacterium]